MSARPAPTSAEPDATSVRLVRPNTTAGRRTRNLRILQPASPVRFPVVPGCSMPPGVEPCVRTGCRYHLARPDRGGRPLHATRDCALTVANEGPHTLEEIAQVLGMTRERARQIEETATEKLQRNAALRRLYDELE